MTANVWIFDCEVFAHDWLVVARKPEDGATHRVFYNKNFELARWINEEQPVLGGYNAKHYDQWIIKAIYHGADNATVKALNDFIISGRDGWNFPWLAHKETRWAGFDLMDDIPVPLRLKEIEGNLGMSIEESSIPFSIDRPLTADELEEVIRYCKHDVDATVRLFHARRDYLQSKLDVGRMAGLTEAESLRLTNAKLTAAFLRASFYDRQDAEQYDFPDNLRIKRYTQTLEFFSQIDPLYKKKLQLEIADAPHTVAWGGLHGALEHYHERSTGRRLVTHLDVTSYYPSLMIVNGYMSRSVPEPAEFTRVYQRRIEAKRSGDKATANALKLVLNSTYGAMKNPYNALYDPRMANAVCISGQLYLIDLIEKLEAVPTFKLIQSNTDGLIVSYDVAHGDALHAVLREWDRRTGFSLGEDTVDSIYQKDVNNYVMRLQGGEVEVKGGYVSNYRGGDFVNASLPIVAKAVVEHLLHGIPIEETIRRCTDVSQFQMICKAGSTYDAVVWRVGGEDVPVQTVNRVYATFNGTFGGLYKLKNAASRREKIANTPDHCLIDNAGSVSIGQLDLQFYIDTAQKRVNDYLTPKPKRERKKPMSTTPKPQQEPLALDAQTALYRKLFALQTIMDGYSWQKDGKNRHQSYEYITEKQYKHNFRQARAQAGLLWKMEETGHEFLGTISDKMHLILTTFRGRLIDPDTGAFEEYLFSGSGADNGDKALYKAYTGGLKFFLASNFLVAEDNDPESDETETRADKPRYTQPESRADAKAKLTNQDSPATDEQIEAIAMGIEMLQKANVDDLITSSFIELLDNPLTRAEAEAILEGIAEAIPDDAA